MVLCHLHFDASKCFWKQDIKKPIQKQIEFCVNMKCPHGSISERPLANGKTASFVTCDLTWNPMSWKPTTNEEREEMEV
jgi:hypothetical protein